MTANAQSLAAYADSAHHHEADRQKILAYLAEHPEGVTCDKLAEIWDRPQHHISGRFSDLKKAGLIVPSGRREKTRSGSFAAICVLKPKGALF